MKQSLQKRAQEGNTENTGDAGSGRLEKVANEYAKIMIESWVFTLGGRFQLQRPWVNFSGWAYVFSSPI